MNGSRTYLKPKNGSGARVTQAIIGAEPLRDEPPDAAVEEHSRPTLGGKHGSIGYTILPRRVVSPEGRWHPGGAFTMSVTHYDSKNTQTEEGGKAT